MKNFRLFFIWQTWKKKAELKFPFIEYYILNSRFKWITKVAFIHSGQHCPVLKQESVPDDKVKENE